MATLNNTRISDTYFGLIKTIDNAAISATLKELSDGSGNATGLSINNAGDFKVNSVLEFGSLKDTGENIVISKFVDAADGIGNNNNDTSIPTSAAVVSYVAAQITAEDLDFTGDDASVAGDVDLNSEQFRILGTANEIETSVVSAGGTQLRIGIVNNPTLTGIVTATTFSGDLNGTINTATTAVTQSQGDNSTKVATTAYVDVLDAASDLDFSGDSGTGDVTLNTQTFAVTGTTNQITTSASGQTLNLSLPSTVHRNIQGNVTGNLTGNVTGNVTGDLTGNVTATSVLASGVTATTQSTGDNSTKIATTAYVDSLDAASDLDFGADAGSGAVVLNTQTLSIVGTTQEVETSASNQQLQIGLPSSINVNSASATILQNARDISLTGQATATISSFNGSSNVSGAVTLDNNSVTGKVLTGLAAPTATNITASDTILQAFGKAQSQINTLAGGLRFMGTWNATTNTPTLASGGGESASGTTTSTTANKLVDSSASFTNAVDGDRVVNQASGATATVDNVDSSTVLTLSADIMVSGQEYTIDNSPFITQGHYFVVSVGGTSSLNGLSNWAVGDWVIAGANNTWEKLDHTQVDGTGTTGNITKWESTNVIADSIMAESGSTISVTGSLSTSQLLSSGGNFAVNTNKFTANATTGDVALAGGLTIGTKGLISIIAGNNITISGTDVDHSGLSFATNAILPAVVSATNSGIVDLGANSERFKVVYGIYADFSQSSTTAPVLKLSDTGVADYDFTFPDTGTIQLGVNTSSTKTLKLLNAGSGLFGLEVNGAATFAGDVAINGATGITGLNGITFENGCILDDSIGAEYLKLKYNGASGGGLQVFDNQNRVQGYLYASGGATSEFGLLNGAGQWGVRTTEGAGTALFYGASSEKLTTTSTGVSVTGSITAGTGLQLYTDGSGNGVIYNLGQDKDLYFVVDDGGTGVNALVFDSSNGGAATFAGDVTSSGNIGSTIDANTTNQLSVTNSNSGSSATARFLAVSDSGNIQIKAVSSTNTTYGAGDVGVINCDTMSNGLRFAHNDQVKYTLAFDGFNTWTGGGSFGGNLIIHNTSNAPYIDFVESGATTDSKARITMDQVDTNNGSLLFATENAGTLATRMQINSSGRVGINETNDARTQLEVKATTSSRNTVTRILTLNANGDAIQPYEPFGTGIIFEGFDYAGGGGTSTSRDYAYLDARIETSGSTPVDFTSRLVFATNSGGSSTTTPTTKLVIKGNGQMVNTMDLSGLSTNLLLANLNDTDGDTAGIGFSMLDNGTYIKSGIYFERTTTQGRGDLIFAMNNTVDGQNVALADEAMRIRPNKVVEIGANSSQSNSKLNVRNNGSAIEFGHTNNGDWYFGTVGSFGSNGQPMITFSTFCEQSANTFTTKGAKGNIITADANGTLFFQQVTSTNTTGQTPSTVMTLYDGGRLHPSGGIFLGSSNNSNLLDDYKEGNWTPQIYYQNSTDQGNSTNTTQTGIYTKVGRKVTVMFRLVWEITGSPATDNIGIGNLPFNGQSISNNSTYADVPCTLKGYSNPSTGGRGSLTLTLPNNNSDKALFNDSNMVGNMGGVIGAGTHEMRFSFTYTTDQ